MNVCPTCSRSFLDGQPVCPLDGARLVAGEGSVPIELGRQLGQYKLIAVLGEGGMGTLYIGAHTRIDRYVAIKVLRPELTTRKGAVARFFDEAKAVNQIRHPNIVESIDMVEDVLDGVYWVLELLRGPNLAARLEAGPVPIASVIHIGAQVADALAAVHEQGIVHRDLKPANLILIERDGRDDFVKLIDFGVAKIDDAAGGQPFGTAAYMAPEQAAGERVDGRADLYALGVLLFQMATGRHPFPSATDSEYVIRHAHDAPPRASKVSPRVPGKLDSVIARLLAKDPEDRFATAGQVATALRAIDVKTARRGGRRGAWVIASLAIIGAGIAALVLVPKYLATDPARAQPPIAGQATSPPPPKPAARPVDQPPVAPPQPTDVTIAFVSSPPGARVYREGETLPLGTTPFETTLRRSDRALRVRFELADHVPVEQEVSLAQSGEVGVSLAAVAKTPPPVAKRPVRPATGKKQPGLHREGVIDPFAKPKK